MLEIKKNKELTKDSKRILTSAYGYSMFSVEVNYDGKEFPFDKFKKKPEDHSENYPRFASIDTNSWASYGFDRLSDAKKFAARADTLEEMSTRIFESVVEVAVSYELVPSCM